MTVRRMLLHPFSPLVCYATGLCVCSIAYAAAGYPPPRTFEPFASRGWRLLMAIWIVADAHHRRRLPCYDLGFLCLLFFPVSLLWYCLWSRRWRGLLTLGLILLLWLIPAMVALVVEDA